MPKHPGEWNNEGIAFFENAQYKEAINCYNKALEIDPNFIQALNNMGNVLRILKRYTEALEVLNKAISKDKTNTETIG